MTQEPQRLLLPCWSCWSCWGSFLTPTYGLDELQGFTASNETKQSLSSGETDDDMLIGGQGNDTYIVNSVNDVIYEQAGQGYDTVVTNTNYLLNAHIEELRLLEGYAIHGTGNATNNTLIGNSSDNILDGVGAEQMRMEVMALMFVPAIGLHVLFPCAQEDKVSSGATKQQPDYPEHEGRLSLIDSI